MIQLQCRCGKTLKLKDEAAGKKVKCRYCNAVSQVPESTDDSSEPDESDLLDLIEQSIGVEGVSGYGDVVSDVQSRRQAKADRKKKEEEALREEQEDSEREAAQKWQDRWIIFLIVGLLSLVLVPFSAWLGLFIWGSIMRRMYSDMPLLLRILGWAGVAIGVVWLVFLVGTIPGMHRKRATQLRARQDPSRQEVLGFVAWFVGLVLCGAYVKGMGQRLLMTESQQMNIAATDNALATFSKQLPPLVAKCRAIGNVERPQIDRKILVLHDPGGSNSFREMLSRDEAESLFPGRIPGFHEIATATPESGITIFVYLGSGEGGGKQTIYVDGNEGMPVESFGAIANFAVIRYVDKTPQGLVQFQVPPPNSGTFPGFYDRNNPPVVRAVFDPLMADSRQLLGGWIRSLPTR